MGWLKKRIRKCLNKLNYFDIFVNKLHHVYELLIGSLFI